MGEKTSGREIGNGETGIGVRYTFGLMPEDHLILPIFNKVVVRRDESPKKIGAIWVPEQAREQQPMSGKVVAVGPEAAYVTPGDDVIFGQYSGSQVKVDMENFTILKDTDVLVVLEDKERGGKERGGKE